MIRRFVSDVAFLRLALHRLAILALSAFLLPSLAPLPAEGRPLDLSGPWDIRPLQLSGGVEFTGEWNRDSEMTLHETPSHVSEAGPAFVSHGWWNAAPYRLGANASLTQHLLLEEDNPPEAVAIRLHTLSPSTWTPWIVFKAAGASLPEGLVNAPTTTRSLPRAGHWTRLEVELGPDSGGLAGTFIDGVEYAAAGGKVWWSLLEILDDRNRDTGATRITPPHPGEVNLEEDPALWTRGAISIPGAWCNPDPSLGGDLFAYANYTIPDEFVLYDQVLLRRSFDAVPFVRELLPDDGARLSFTGGVNHSGAWRINESPWFPIELPMTPFRSGDIREYLRDGTNEVVVHLRRPPINPMGEYLQPSGTAWARTTGGILGEVRLEPLRPVDAEDVSVRADHDPLQVVANVRLAPLGGYTTGGTVKLQAFLDDEPLTAAAVEDFPVVDSREGVSLAFVLPVTEPDQVALWTPEDPRACDLVAHVTPTSGAPYQFSRPFGWSPLRIEGEGEKARLLFQGEPYRLMADQWEFLGPVSTHPEYVEAGYRIARDLGANAVHLNGMPFPALYQVKALEAGMFLLVDCAEADGVVRSATYADLLERMQAEYAWRYSGNPAIVQVNGDGPGGDLSRVMQEEPLLASLEDFPPLRAQAWAEETAASRPGDYFEALGEEWAKRILAARAAGPEGFVMGPLVGTLVQPMPGETVSPAPRAADAPAWVLDQVVQQSVPLPPGWSIEADVQKRNPAYDRVKRALLPLHLSFEEPPASVWSEQRITRHLLLLNDHPRETTATVYWALRGQGTEIASGREEYVVPPLGQKRVELSLTLPRVLKNESMALTAGLTHRHHGARVHLTVLPEAFRVQKLLRISAKPAVVGQDAEAERVLKNWFTDLPRIEVDPEAFVQHLFVFVLPNTVTPENGDAVVEAVEAATERARNVIFLAQEYLPPGLYPGSGVRKAGHGLVSPSPDTPFLQGLEEVRYSLLSRGRSDYPAHGLALPTEGRYLSYLDGYPASSDESSQPDMPALSAVLQVAPERGKIFFYQLPVGPDEADSLLLFARVCMAAQDEALAVTRRPLWVLPNRPLDWELVAPLGREIEAVNVAQNVPDLATRGETPVLFMDGYSPLTDEAREWALTFVMAGGHLLLNNPNPEAGDWTALLPPKSRLQGFPAPRALPARYGQSRYGRGVSVSDLYATGIEHALSAPSESIHPLFLAQPGWSLAWGVGASPFAFPALTDRMTTVMPHAQSLLTYHSRGRGGILVSTADIGPHNIDQPSARRVLLRLVDNLFLYPPGEAALPPELSRAQ